MLSLASLSTQYSSIILCYNVADLMQVTDNYCQDAAMPLAWVHPLKEREAFLEVARVSGACNWTASGEPASEPESI